MDKTRYVIMVFVRCYCQACVPKRGVYLRVSVVGEGSAVRDEGAVQRRIDGDPPTWKTNLKDRVCRVHAVGSCAFDGCSKRKSKWIQEYRPQAQGRISRHKGGRTADRRQKIARG